MDKSIERLLEHNKFIKTDKKGLLDTGKRRDGRPFYPTLAQVEEYARFYGDDIYEYADPNVEEIEPDERLDSGSPMYTKQFPLVTAKLIKLLFSRHNHLYPAPAGDPITRKRFADYCVAEGITKTTSEHIAFMTSTTYAYEVVLDCIVRPEDVVLMTGPNYGLFTYSPERFDGRMELIDLRKEDDYYINPDLLAQRIDEINHSLEEEFKGKLAYTPKVVAFLNLNPHNPLGKVLSKKNEELLKGMGEVCLNRGVFVIDDLIYRDLTFDRDNLALPLAIYDEHFENTISLFGLSKAFGAASYRTGAIVASEYVIRAIRSKVFRDMLGTPRFQSEAIAAAYNASGLRYRQYERYMKPIIKEYIYRYNLIKAFVTGIESVDVEYHRRIRRDIKKYIPDTGDREIVLKGMTDVCIAEKTEPESGFFCLIDLTKLKGKRYEDFTIQSEKDILKYLYNKTKSKFILGQSMGWPYQDEIIIRVSFSLEIKDIIKNFWLMNTWIEKLK